MRQESCHPAGSVQRCLSPRRATPQAAPCMACGPAWPLSRWTVLPRALPGRSQQPSQAQSQHASWRAPGPSGVVQVYTLRTHSVVQTLHFSSRVLSVRASCRLLIVALDAQVHDRSSVSCFPAARLITAMQGLWLVQTYIARHCRPSLISARLTHCLMMLHLWA